MTIGSRFHPTQITAKDDESLNTRAGSHGKTKCHGNAMNLTSGIFTAPRPGIYFFSFTGLASFPSSSSRVYLGVGLILNGSLIGTGYVAEENTPGQYSLLTLQSTLKLKKGDQVWVAIWSKTGAYLADLIYNHYTHFTGFMLEEDIVASLS